MPDTPAPSVRARNRQATRDAVLDAAERLLRQSPLAEFSMRELAAEAGVGFATPFNHFGSKSMIMQGLSARLIAVMAARFRARNPPGDAIDRTLEMGRIAVDCLLEQPDVTKAVVGALGSVGTPASAVRGQSRDLWATALGDLRGLAPDLHERARSVLPDQIAFAFRGCLSFWIAGEIADSRLAAAVETSAATTLLGFARPARRGHLLDRMTFQTSARTVPAHDT